MKNKISAGEKDILLCYIKNISKEELYKEKNLNLTKKELKLLNKLIEQREKGIPLAYLTHSKEFFGRNFYCNKNVLVPRPETEMIIEEILKKHKKNDTVSIIDIGTGSGNIAVTLACELPQATITATDVSKKALTVAKKNAKRLLPHKKITFIKSNLLKNIKSDADILIANLPYLKNTRNKEILKKFGLYFEPRISLFGGKDGLKFYKKLILQIKGRHFKTLYFEHNPKQTKTLHALVKKNLTYKKIEIKKDLQGLERLSIITI